jgi:5-methylcytosine-specific restriction endonuclease McrA
MGAPLMPRILKKRTRAGKLWTEARYFQFIRSALRQATMKYPVIAQYKKDNRRTVTGKRHKFEYKCVECKKWKQGKQCAVDHIEPAGSLKSYEDLPGFVARLFCEADNLQILCDVCHKVKTEQERQARKKL